MTLNKRQQTFVDNYLATFNATNSALAAGYSKKTAYSIGSENLKKPEIKAAIELGMTEKSMGKEELLARLSDMARASLDDVLDLDDEFDMRLARGSGKIHLVKSITRMEFTDKQGNTTRTTTVSLHDAQSALMNLAKIKGLFTTKIEVSDLRDKKDSEIVDEFAGLVDKARTRASDTVSGGDETPRLDSGEADAGDVAG